MERWPPRRYSVFHAEVVPDRWFDSDFDSFLPSRQSSKSVPDTVFTGTNGELRRWGRGPRCP